DGIRDRNVTGVQTCALPILRRPRSARRPGSGRLTSLASLPRGVGGAPVGTHGLVAALAALEVADAGPEALRVLQLRDGVRDDEAEAGLHWGQLGHGEPTNIGGFFVADDGFGE